MPGTGINASRVLVGGRANQIGGQLRDSLQRGAVPNFYRAVVLEVFYNPDLITQEQKDGLKNLVSNPDFVDSMPANSILARIVTGGNDAISSLGAIVYPFFQSHFSLPVQAGEQVCVVYEDQAREGIALGKWITRIHENRFVEDLNYTHADRRFSLEINASSQTTSQQANRGSDAPRPPAFPNGGNSPDSYTLTTSGSVNPYDSIFRESHANKLHTFESSPRYTKRPQEFVIQGTNNSLISLGRDRISNVSLQPNAPGKKPNAGSVDIVCGRARYPLAPTDNQINQQKPTSPYVVVNSREKTEVDKTPALRRRPFNVNEGNPDLKTDAARVLVSMNTDADTNLKIKHSTNAQEGIDYPSNTLHPEQPVAPNAIIGNSYVVTKADHIRIVARKDAAVPSPPGGVIKGTILLVKEGVKDSDLAYLYIDKEGRMQLSAKKIFLGKAATADPDSNDHQEPYIKWTVYDAHMRELKTQIKALADSVKILAQNCQIAFAGAIAIPFSPVATLVAGSTAIAGATPAQILAVKAGVDRVVTADAKSTTIFGS